MFFGNFAFWDPATSQADVRRRQPGRRRRARSTTAIRVNGGDGDSFVAKLIPQELGAGLHDRRSPTATTGSRCTADRATSRTASSSPSRSTSTSSTSSCCASSTSPRSSATAPTSSPRSRATPSSARSPSPSTASGCGSRSPAPGAVLSFKPPDGFGFSLDASDHPARRLPARRRGARPLRRRARDRGPGEVRAHRDRHHHHQEARRLTGLLAADADHGHAAGADPARLRVLLRRRRRAARPQPRHGRRPDPRRPAHRHRRLHPVPHRHHQPHRRDRPRPRGGLPRAGGPLPDRPDGDDHRG